MKRFMFMAVCVALIAAFISGCGSSTPSSSAPATTKGKAGSKYTNLGPKAQPHLTIVSASMGSGWYPVSVMFSNFWMDAVPGLNVMVQEGGAVANVKTVNKGVDGNIGWCYTTDVSDAFKGAAAFGGEAYKDAMPIASTYPVWLNIITMADNKKIFKVEDLVGAKVHVGTVNSGSELATKRLLEAHGITFDDIRAAGGRIEYGTHSDAAQMLKDGVIDVMIGSGSPEVPAALEIEAQNNVRLIPVEQDKLEKVVKLGYNYLINRPIPAKTFKGQDKDVPTLSYLSVIIVNRKLSDDLAYMLTKEIWDNIDTIRKEQPVRGNMMDISTALDGIDLATLHPGAAKYYKEVGKLK